MTWFRRWVAFVFARAQTDDAPAPSRPDEREKIEKARAILQANDGLRQMKLAPLEASGAVLMLRRLRREMDAQAFLAAVYFLLGGLCLASKTMFLTIIGGLMLMAGVFSARAAWRLNVQVRDVMRRQKDREEQMARWRDRRFLASRP